VYDDSAYAKVRADMKKELDRLRKHYQDDGSVVEFDTARARDVKLQQVLGLSFDDETLNPAYKPLAVGAWCRADSPSGVLISQVARARGSACSCKTTCRSSAFVPRAFGNKFAARG
jgi:hypothetical protein